MRSQSLFFTRNHSTSVIRAIGLLDSLLGVPFPAKLRVENNSQILNLPGEFHPVTLNHRQWEVVNLCFSCEQNEFSLSRVYCYSVRLRNPTSYTAHEDVVHTDHLQMDC